MTWHLRQGCLAIAAGTLYLASAGDVAGAEMANARWSPWIRLLKGRADHARGVTVPATTLLTGALGRIDFSDAFQVRAPAGAGFDPQAWADAIFRTAPTWVKALMTVREVAVGLAGIERGGPAAFETLARTDDEVLVGIDQSHLSFRASILSQPGRVTLSTIVQVHNLRGRLYWALVRPIHPLVAKAMLFRAARRLTPTRLIPPPARQGASSRLSRVRHAARSEDSLPLTAPQRLPLPTPS